MRNTYILNNSLEKRIEECSKLVRKYPERIPIIIITNNIQIKRIKYLVDKSLSFTQFALILKRNIEDINPEEALYYFTENNEVIVPSMIINQLYLNCKNKHDGFLYIFVSKENTFGSK